MAKRLLIWTRKGSLLQVNIEKESVLINLPDLYPDFEKMSDAQQGYIINGVKQRLADKTEAVSGVKMTSVERAKWMKTVWELAVKEGVYRKQAIGGLSTLERDLRTLNEMVEQLNAYPDMSPEAVKKVMKGLHVNGRTREEIGKAIELKKAEDNNNK